MDNFLADDALETSTYDYIVVGSGPGGGPVAANLAEAGFSVLVLEAGPPSGNEVYRDVPSFFAQATEDPEVAWEYWVQHHDGGKAAHGDMWVDEKGGLLYPRASALGGCSIHNSGIIMFPPHSDWDDIAELTGDNGWHHEAMWQHWQKVLEWQAVSAKNPFAQLASPRTDPGGLIGSLKGPNWFLKSLGGAERSGEINDKDNVGTAGIWNLQIGIKGGVRHGVRDRLISAERNCPMLEIQCDALVEKILFEPGRTGPRAVGVQFLNGRHLYEASPKFQETTEEERAALRQVVRARREIIVAGGAYNSPQILMLSGIGPADHLQAHGIEVLLDSPCVGANLQDRREISVIDRYAVPELAEDRYIAALIRSLGLTGPRLSVCLSGWRADPENSPLGQFGIPCVTYRTEGADGSAANCVTLGVPTQFRAHHPGWVKEALTHAGQSWTWLTLMGYTGDRNGYVRLRSGDPTRCPEINFRAFGNGTGGEKDLAALTQAIEMCRELNRAEPGEGEIYPGPHVQDLGDFIRREHYGHHPACTNSLGGTIDDSVVDSSFKVHGAEGLRIVDASVFPKMPGLFLIAAIQTLSQKASVDILRDAGD